MNDFDWRAEGHHLLGLYDAVKPLVERERAWFEDWAGRVRSLIVSDTEARQAEQALENLSAEFRSGWIIFAHDHFAAYHWRSPTFGTTYQLPTGAQFRCAYERLLAPTTLEARCQLYRKAPAGWESETILFSSGMAALSTFLNCLVTAYDRTADRPLKLMMWGGYFETLDVLALVRNPGCVCTIEKDQQALFSEVERGAVDIVLFEPVRYDLNQDVFDLEGFIGAWRRQQPTERAHKVIIVDTSAVGHTFPMVDFLERISEAVDATVVQIASGLKFDQQGLEFANNGIITIFSKPEIKQKVELASHVRRMRGVLGASLSLYEVCLLDFPLCFEYASFSAHCQAVFRNNAFLAQAIGSSTNLFTKVTHPVLSAERERPWAQSPHVLFQVAEATADDYLWLYRILYYESWKHNICFRPGSSFGFRGHRYEWVRQRGEEPDFMRIQMGARNGPSLQMVSELLQHISMFPDMEMLKGAYPELQKLSS